MDKVLLSLAEGLLDLDYRHFIMYAIGIVLIYLAIKKNYEPMLLLPIGFGAILVNLPLSSVLTMPGRTYDPEVSDFISKNPELRGFFEQTLHYVFNGDVAYKTDPGILKILFETGILTELFPVLIFIAVGAMIDFTPLFNRPSMIFLGAAAQFGIFATLLVSVLAGFDLKLAASISIIGAADGPTAIFVTSRFAKEYLGPISIAAYSYMSLVPIIQPPVVKLLTTRKERMIRMDYTIKTVSKAVKIIFPISVTIAAGLLAPSSVPLIGLLMFGNLIRESGVLERLSKSAQNELANLVTLLLGITIGSTLSADKFLQPSTLFIILIGAAAFVLDTAGGVLFAKLFNMFTSKKINPMIGAAGISAFPMSARVIHRMAQKEDPTNFILMPAVSANVSGQLGSVIAGGLLLALIPIFAG